MAAGILEGVSRSGRLQTIDPWTGATTTIGNLYTSDVVGLTYDTERRALVGVERVLNAIVAIDTDTGVGMTYNTLGHTGLSGMAYDSESNSLYIMSRGTDVVVEVRLDTLEVNVVADTVYDSAGFALVRATDCNGNAALDVCDIAAGVSQDCQTNGAPDECDIDGGISSDTNLNGIPDECEVQSLELPASPHDATKHRHLSIATNTNGLAQVALCVELVSMNRPAEQGVYVRWCVRGSGSRERHVHPASGCRRGRTLVGAGSTAGTAGLHTWPLWQ